MVIFVILLALLILYVALLSLFAKHALSIISDLDSNIALLRKRSIVMSKYVLETYKESDALDKVEAMLKAHHVKDIMEAAADLSVMKRDDDIIKGYSFEIATYYESAIEKDEKLHEYISRWYNRGFSSILALGRRDYFAI